MRRLLLLTFATAVLLAVGCGSDSDGGDEAGDGRAAQVASDEQPKKRATTNARAPRGTTIKLADSQYGKVVFDRSGQAIYLFAKERSQRSECYGECAAAWPPVLTRGAPRAGTGIDEELLGTTRRSDGKLQVTYNGHPLYYYAHEPRNEVRCHNVREFGGLWLVLDRNGNALA